MTSASHLATRFYQLKRGHAPIDAYLNDSDTEKMTVLVVRGMLGQTTEHLLHHCSRWKYQQRELRKKVEGNGLERWPMAAGTGGGAVFHGDV